MHARSLTLIALRSALARALVGLVVLGLTVAELGCATTQASHVASSKKHRSHKAHAPSGGVGAGAADTRDSEAEGGDGDGDRDGDHDDGELTAVVASEGAASFYHDSLAGRMTANGEKYDPESSTCAHRSLPFGTVLVVEDVATGKKSHCRVNDRGPYVDGRMIDVSRRVARDLGMIDRGVIRVRIRIAKTPTVSELFVPSDEDADLSFPG